MKKLVFALFFIFQVVGVTQQLEAALTVRPEHPRIHLSPDNIAEYKARWDVHPRKSQCLAKAEDGSDPIAAAFAYQMTGNVTYARTAINKALGGALTRTRSLALVFDWCYDQLTASEKSTLMTTIKSKISSVTPSDSSPTQWVFHSEEWASNVDNYDPDGGLYDSTWYGWLAIAGDDPNAASKFVKLWENGTMTKPAAAFSYLNDGAWNEGGYWIYQAKQLLMLDRFLLLKSATGGSYSSEYLKKIGDFILYQTDVRNTKAMWNVIGDGGQFWGNDWQIRRNMLYATAWSQSPYQQWYLRNISGHQPKATDTWVNYDSWAVYSYTGIEDMLFYNPLLEARTVDELPLSRFFPGVGLMLMRSGWDKDATHVSFKASDFLDGHNHFDAGSFQIFKKGYALVPDTGTYSYFGNDHYRNWFLRTIAHSTIQIENPAENVSYYAHVTDDNVKKDGSQPYPGVRARNMTEFTTNIAYTNLADIPAWENTSSYDYVSSNITAAYNKPLDNQYKADTVKRELVFLKDGYLIVNDRVESKQPEYKKRWLLHLEGEPVFGGLPSSQEVPGYIETYSSGQSITSTHPKSSQKLHVKTVLPASSSITKIGGRRLNIPSNTLKQGTFTGTIGHLSDDSVVPMHLEYWNDTAATPRYERGIYIVNQSTNCNVTITVDASTLSFSCSAAVNPDHNTTASVDLATFNTFEKVSDELNRQFIANDANKYNDWKSLVSAGYEFWNNGKNYPIEPGTDSNYYAKWKNGDISTGKWRIEISPSVASKKDNFLNVLYMPDSGAAMPSVSSVDAGLMTGVFIADATENRVVLFNSDFASTPVTNEVTYTVTTTGSAKHLLFGLAPKSLYSFDIDGTVATKKTGTAGALSFTSASAGVHTIKVKLSGTAGIYPAQPTDIKLAGTSSPKTATVTWTLSADDGAGDNDVTHYNIYRSNSKDGPYNDPPLGTVLKGITTFTDNAPTGGWNYYKVSAVDNGSLASPVDTMDAPSLVFDSPSVTAVSVKDRSSSSAAYTNERIVNLTMTATDPQGDNTITKYLVNESSAKPSSATMTASGSATAPTTYTLTSAEGSVTVYVWVMDADLNVSDLAPGSSATITLDLTAPSASGTPDLAAADDTGDSTTDNLTKNTTALTISGTGETGATVQLYDGASAVGSTGTVSGGVYSIDISLAAGAHSITAKQTDPAGNVSVASAALSITVDTTAPAAPAGLDLAADDDTGTAADDNITSKTTGLSISGTGETGAKVQLYDGGSVISGATATVSGGVFSIDISLAEGTHSITAVQTDPAGNASAASAALSITVDTTAPEVASITGSVPALSTWYGSKIVTVQLTGATDAGSGMGGYAVAWDTSNSTIPAVAYDKPASITSVASPDMGDGNSVYFHIRAVDKAGNAGTTVHYGPFWIDTVLPSLVSITTDTPDGAYMAGDTVNVTLNFSEPVTLSGGSLHLVMNSGATVNLSVIASASSVTVPYTIQDSQAANVLNVTSFDLDSAAKIADAAGTEVVQLGNVVEIPHGHNLADVANIVVDTTAPSQGSLAATIGMSQTNLSWSGFAEEAGGSGMNRYKLVMSASGYPPSSCAGGTPLTLSGDLALAYTHSGLSSGATYYYRLCAEDKAGNISTGLTASATMPSVDGTGGAVAGIERGDGGSDSNNLVDGKPSVDVDYTFKITVTDTTAGGTPRNVRLYLTQRDTPTSSDFYSFDMTCGASWTTGAVCTHTTRLGPAYAHKYHFEAVLADGSTLRYPASGEISGPSVQLLNGFNMIGVPRSGATFAAFGGAEAYAWSKTALDYVRLLPGRAVSPGEGFFILRGTEPVLPMLDAWTEPSANEVEIQLSQGWNLISNPFSGDVELADVKVKRGAVTKTWAEAATDRWLYNAIYYYKGEDWGGKYASESAGGYVDAKLVPWLGYWVYLARSQGDYSLVISKP